MLNRVCLGAQKRIEYELIMSQSLRGTAREGKRERERERGR